MVLAYRQQNKEIPTGGSLLEQISSLLNLSDFSRYVEKP
jgi:hypothetical protein